eukprot:Amastigsp_a174811_5.p3 type:complete len:187 gc:universal Amastigsp_a174811_5:605-45(-)
MRALSESASSVAKRNRVPSFDILNECALPLSASVDGSTTQPESTSASSGSQSFSFLNKNTHDESTTQKRRFHAFFCSGVLCTHPTYGAELSYDTAGRRNSGASSTSGASVDGSAAMSSCGSAARARNAPIHSWRSSSVSQRKIVSSCASFRTTMRNCPGWSSSSANSVLRIASRSLAAGGSGGAFR